MATAYQLDALQNLTAVSLNASTLSGNPYGYTGRRYDPETQLWYYRNRMYSASLGRFLQRDPARFVDGYNIYAYVQNRPVIFFDPMGLYFWESARIQKIRELNEQSAGLGLSLGSVAANQPGIFRAALQGAANGAAVINNALTFGQVDSLRIQAAAVERQAFLTGDTLSAAGFGFGKFGVHSLQAALVGGITAPALTVLGSTSFGAAGIETLTPFFAVGSGILATAGAVNATRKFSQGDISGGVEETGNSILYGIMATELMKTSFSLARIGVTLDVGGEGVYSDALNINLGSRTTSLRATGMYDDLIPGRLVLGSAYELPIKSGSVRTFITESGPVSQTELARVINSNGIVDLFHPLQPNQAIPTIHSAVAIELGSRVAITTKIRIPMSNNTSGVSSRFLLGDFDEAMAIVGLKNLVESEGGQSSTFVDKTKFRQ